MGEMPDRVWVKNYGNRTTGGLLLSVDTMDPREVHDDGKPVAEYVLASLALPRPWRTAAELEALPVGSVVRDRVGNVALRLEYYDDAVHWWASAGLDHEISPQGVADLGPGLILYVPLAAA